MKKPLVIYLLMLFCVSTNAQLQEKIKSEGVVPGTIIKEGKEVQGYIKRMGRSYLVDTWYDAPWDFQKDIRFMEKSAFEGAEKIRNKDFEKYEASDIEGYKYNNDSLTFESVKYSDMSAVGTGMIAKKMFMRKMSSGKIALYQHFSLPPSVGEVSSMKQSYIENATPNIVYKIGADGKLKAVNALNVKKELADCPAVVEKYEKGSYGADSEDEKQSGLAKLANKTVFREGVRYRVIEDYNNTCK